MCVYSITQDFTRGVLVLCLRDLGTVRLKGFALPFTPDEDIYDHWSLGS
jgi:hypothetical protein